MIRLENVTLSFSDKRVLENFSLTLPETGVTVLSGPSGCGKTTLLRVLAGLETPQSGRVVGISPWETAFLFQEDRLLPGRTVLEQLTDVMAKERRKDPYWGWEATMGSGVSIKKRHHRVNYPVHVVGGFR